VAAVAILVLLGWLLHWPGAVFGASKVPSALPPPAVTSPSSTPSPSVTASSSPPPSPSSPVTASPTASASPPVSPAVATVEAYIAAINARNYARAWQIVGSNTGTTYASFVSGFKGTEKDTLTILSVSGDVVSIRLSALHTSGEVQVFEGTYTVRSGVIVSTDVQLVS
jgi:eukaryotic-like serine/threonine-protein kinase